MLDSRYISATIATQQVKKNSKYIALSPGTILLVNLATQSTTHLAGHSLVAGATDGDCTNARFAGVRIIKKIPGKDAFVIQEDDTKNGDLRKMDFTLSSSGIVSNCKVSTLGDVAGVRGITMLDELTALFLTKSKVMTADLTLEIACHKHPDLLAGLTDIKVREFNTAQKFLPSSGAAGTQVIADANTKWLFTGYRKVKCVSNVGCYVKDAVCSKRCGNGYPSNDCGSSLENCCVGKMAVPSSEITAQEAQDKWLQASSSAVQLDFGDELKVW